VDSRTKVDCGGSSEAFPGSDRCEADAASDFALLVRFWELGDGGWMCPQTARASVIGAQPAPSGPGGAHRTKRPK